MKVHLYLLHTMNLNVRNGDANHKNDVSGLFGSSNFGFSFGASLPLPAGLCILSSSVNNSNSNSIFPLKIVIIKNNFK